jgi:MFS family permease
LERQSKDDHVRTIGDIARIAKIPDGDEAYLPPIAAQQNTPQRPMGRQDRARQALAGGPGVHQRWRKCQSGVALIAGPVAGGAISQGLAWQWIFWINLPIAVIVIPLVTRRIEESFGPNTDLDIPGLALVTGSALGLVWGLMRGNNAGWSSPEVIVALGAGFLLAAAFVGWELRARAPMVPMRLLQSRAFASGVAASYFFYASMYGVLFFLPQFLQTAQGHGPFEAGWRLLP